MPFQHRTSDFSHCLFVDASHAAWSIVHVCDCLQRYGVVAGQGHLRRSSTQDSSPHLTSPVLHTFVHDAWSSVQRPVALHFDSPAAHGHCAAVMAHDLSGQRCGSSGGHAPADVSGSAHSFAEPTQRLLSGHRNSRGGGHAQSLSVSWHVLS